MNINVKHPRVHFIITHLYCSKCMDWHSFEEVKWDKNGSPLCPKFGTKVRIKSLYPRNPILQEIKLKKFEEFRAKKFELKGAAKWRR